MQNVQDAMDKAYTMLLERAFYEPSLADFSMADETLEEVCKVNMAQNEAGAKRAIGGANSLKNKDSAWLESTSKHKNRIWIDTLHSYDGVIILKEFSGGSPEGRTVLSFSYGTKYKRTKVRFNGDSRMMLVPTSLWDVIDACNRRNGVLLLWTDYFNDHMFAGKGALEWAGALREMYKTFPTLRDGYDRNVMNYLNRLWVFQEFISGGRLRTNSSFRRTSVARTVNYLSHYRDSCWADRVGYSGVWMVFTVLTEGFSDRHRTLNEQADVIMIAGFSMLEGSDGRGSYLEDHRTRLRSLCKELAKRTMAGEADSDLTYANFVKLAQWFVLKLPGIVSSPGWVKTEVQRVFVVIAIASTEDIADAHMDFIVERCRQS